MINSLIDNDIILKVCCYEMHAAFAASCADAAISAAVLPIARYVIAAKIKKAAHLNEKDGALAAVDKLIEAYSTVEPEEEELALAASFEERAQSLDFELDGGGKPTACNTFQAEPRLARDRRQAGNLGHRAYC